ncbi:MAG: hypothetical protein ACK5LY_00645 [Lachnospirales bacterium]
MSEEKFNYNYSAKEQKEIIKIKDKYRKKTTKETKVEELKRLDKSATKSATIWSLFLGIIGTLALGIGMVCTMVWISYFTIGVIIGVIGLVLIALSYPIYLKITNKRREKIAPTIMRLAEEIESFK